MSLKYYFERILGWMLNNKIIVLLSLLSFCLFVSTLAIAGQRNRLSREIADLTSTTTTVATTIRQEETTTNGDSQQPVTTVTTESEKTVTTLIPESESTFEANQQTSPGDPNKSPLSEVSNYKNEVTNSKLLDKLGYSL
ncbi:hypothetical protein RR46_06246 [Papilio xuthus]|uniref:Uncharacterized protein n=1 Tax=Papilio xuthus TaxID=66420 RepID=A0A194QC09_PAPXU|nr:hypothetical protein RR46_06246 [Papilio xuthus]